MRNLNQIKRLIVRNVRWSSCKAEWPGWGNAKISWGFCLATAGIAAGSATSLHTRCSDQNHEKRKQKHHATAAIYLVGGPSGAGKDTLLAAAKKDLADSGNQSVVFVKRDITRDPSKCSELEISKTSEEFDAIRAAGGYALSWEAHSTKYGIPKAMLEEQLKAGKRCVLNVSRTVIDECRTKYDTAEVEVYFLNITASAEELTRRLVARAREPPGEIRSRVARAKELEPVGPHVISITNEASVDEGKTLIVGALTGELKYSLWLAPAQESAFQSLVQAFINQISSDLDVKPFSPHITLCPSFKTTQRSAIASAAEVAAAVNTAVPCRTSGAPSINSQKPFRALALEIEESPDILAATLNARKVLFEADDPRFNEAYVPHCSLLYGNHAEDVLQSGKNQAIALAAALHRPRHSKGHGKEVVAEFEMTRVVIVMTTGKAYWCWQEVASFDLKPCE